MAITKQNAVSDSRTTSLHDQPADRSTFEARPLGGPPRVRSSADPVCSEAGATGARLWEHHRLRRQVGRRARSASPRVLTRCALERSFHRWSEPHVDRAQACASLGMIASALISPASILAQASRRSGAVRHVARRFGRKASCRSAWSSLPAPLRRARARVRWANASSGTSSRRPPSRVWFAVL